MNEAEPTVLVTCRQMQVELPKHQTRIEAAGFRVLAPPLNGRQQFTATELLAFTSSLAGIIAGDDELNRQFFDGAPDLRAVIRWGIGMDSVDLKTAASRGVVVRNTPGVFASEVADSAMGYLLDLARGVTWIDRSVRAGAWPKFEGVTLSGKRLGIVGFGSIGRQVARRADGFGMEVVAFDPGVEDANVRLVELDELLSSCEFIVLACPLTPATRHLINHRSLALMRPETNLVNVARGPVVDESALVVALQEGRIRAAALDVYEKEPLGPGSSLRSLDNVILGSHNASNTRDGVARASQAAVDYLLEELLR